MMAHGELGSTADQPRERPADLVEAEAAGLGVLALEAEASPHRQASLWGDAWRRLIRNRLALIGLIVVTTFLILAIFAPLIAPYGESEVVDVRLAGHGPSWTWPFGLDRNGRDLFSRVMYGARVSLLVGVLS